MTTVLAAHEGCGHFAILSVYLEFHSSIHVEADLVDWSMTDDGRYLILTPFS